MNEDVRTRLFNAQVGDRVARKADDPARPTRDFSEAFEYAYRRANRLQTKQFLRKSKSKREWSRKQFLVLNTGIPLGVK